MKRLINLLSDIQSQIEETGSQQAATSESDFDNGSACGVIEGRLSALKEVRSAIAQIIVEMT